MSPDELAELPAFYGCSAVQLSRVRPRPEELEVHAGETIVRRGHAEHEWYVVLEGDAVVTVAERPLARLSAGEHFGELALLTREPWEVTITAWSPMRLLALTEGAFFRLIAECPEFAAGLLTTFARRLSESFRPFARSARTERVVADPGSMPHH